MTFNAACWMRVFSQINSVVSFFIVYEDEEGSLRCWWTRPRFMKACLQ